MQHLKTFVLSEGARYQELTLASQDIEPRAVPGALSDGLDGWSFLMRSPQRDFALAYFEHGALVAKLRGFNRGANYFWAWFDPRQGRWQPAIRLKADAQGELTMPAFPGGGKQAAADAAAKLTEVRRAD
jgi:hypothetical protein